MNAEYLQSLESPEATHQQENELFIQLCGFQTRTASQPFKDPWCYIDSIRYRNRRDTPNSKTVANGLGLKVNRNKSSHQILTTQLWDLPPVSVATGYLIVQSLRQFSAKRRKGLLVISTYAFHGLQHGQTIEWSRQPDMRDKAIVD